LTKGGKTSLVITIYNVSTSFAPTTSARTSWVQGGAGLLPTGRRPDLGLVRLDQALRFAGVHWTRPTQVYGWFPRNPRTSC